MYFALALHFSFSDKVFISHVEKANYGHLKELNASNAISHTIKRAFWRYKQHY